MMQKVREIIHLGPLYTYRPIFTQVVQKVFSDEIQRPFYGLNLFHIWSSL